MPKWNKNHVTAIHPISLTIAAPLLLCVDYTTKKPRCQPHEVPRRVAGSSGRVDTLAISPPSFLPSSRAFSAHA
jgi:hypothetical protein